MASALPHPTNTLPFGSTCMLPAASAYCLSGWVYSRTSVALIFSSSSSSTMPRDSSTAFGSAIFEDRGAVIEDGDGAVGQAPGVVLEGESGAWTHLEVALLAAKAPYDLAPFAVYLVDGGGFAGRDQQVVVVVHVYGVEVEVVDAGAAILQRRDIGLVQAHMVEAIAIRRAPLRSRCRSSWTMHCHTTPSFAPPIEERSRGTGL